MLCIHFFYSFRTASMQFPYSFYAVSVQLLCRQHLLAKAALSTKWKLGLDILQNFNRHLGSPHHSHFYLWNLLTFPSDSHNRPLELFYTFLKPRASTGHLYAQRASTSGLDKACLCSNIYQQIPNYQKPYIEILLFLIHQGI